MSCNVTNTGSRCGAKENADAVGLNAILFTFRLGASFGLARAYLPPPWSYWPAPVADLPAALKLIQSALKMHHCWRGRTYLHTGGGTFEPIENSK